jgi:Ca2+-binding RTX toxin-like protein
LANTIVGSADNDIIFGQGGSDTVNGGAGDDFFYMSGSGSDVIDGGDGYDWYQTFSGMPFGLTANLSTGKIYFHGAPESGPAEIDTVVNIEAVRGTMFDDTLIGDSGNNVLRGRAGDDFLLGRGGSDWAYYNESAASSGIEVNLADEAAYNDGFGGFDILVDVENVRGSGLDDDIVGDDEDNRLEGQNGNDSLVAGGGNDRLSGGAGNDTLVGQAGFDTLEGGAGNDLLIGVLDPYERSTASYLDSASAVTVNLALGGAQNTGGGGTDTLVNIRALWGSSFSDVLSGNGDANWFFGANGDDTINGQGGDDTFHAAGGNDVINGGTGNDTVWYGQAATGVTINLGLAGAQNTVAEGLDTLVSIENVVGSDFNDMLTGSNVNNRMTGGDGNDNINGGNGNDTLEGGNGNDTLTGGLGVDWAIFYNAGAGVSVNLNLATNQNTGGAGVDRLSGIENVEGSMHNDVITGSALDNDLQGFAGDDLLVGGAGNDVLDGGYNNYDSSGNLPAENDTASYAAANAGVTVRLDVDGLEQDIGADQGLDILNAVEHLIGSAFADRLIGAWSNNRLDGGAGDDRIHADGGVSDFELRHDTLLGGTGIDTLVLGSDNGYFADGVGAAINLALTTAQVYQGLPFREGAVPEGFLSISGFENVIGSIGNDQLTGTAGNNLIEGGGGDDTVIGGAGIDTLSYANSEFHWNVGDSGVVVSLALAVAQNTGAAGTDTVSGFENLIGSGWNDVLTGSTANNVIEGGYGNDTINGGAGFDTASYAGTASGVTVSLAIGIGQNTFGAGIDRLTAMENLLGSAFNDNLTGNNGANQITGGRGSDVLTGGLGIDTFIFTSLLDSVVGAADTIADFSAAQGDRINLALIDANSLTAGNGVFSFVGTDVAFTGAGQLRFDSATHTLQANVDANLGSDMEIVLTGVNSLVAANFVL